MDQNEFRMMLIGLGLLVLAAIYWFGRPKRVESGRREPKMPWIDDTQPELSAGVDVPMFSLQTDMEPQLERDVTSAPVHAVSARVSNSEVEMVPGERQNRDFDLIITLHVMASGDGRISGGELVVAAEKASLVYGAQGLFHRLVDGRPEAGPIFSMINTVQPGRFDLSRINELSSPGLSLFMTLPCAISGLDAWDRMLPAAQRIAGLLHAEVYDEEMNLLGRQRIASIRDQLRAYDRRHETRAR
jgi:cell division protein ZipA